MTAPHSDQMLQKSNGTQKGFSLEVMSDLSSPFKKTIELDITSFHDDVSGIQHEAEKRMVVTSPSQSDHTSQAVFDAEQNFYSEIVTDISWSPRETIELETKDLKVSKNSVSELVPLSCKMSSNLNDSEINSFSLAKEHAPLTSQDVEKPLSTSSFNEIQTRCIQPQKMLEESECISEISNSHEASTVHCRPQLFGTNIQGGKIIFSSPDLHEMSIVSNLSDDPTTGLQPRKKLKEKCIRESNNYVSPSMPKSLENKDENRELPDTVQLSVREEGSKTVSGDKPQSESEIVLLPESEREDSTIVDNVTDSYKQNKTSGPSAKVRSEIKDCSSSVSSTASLVKFENKETAKVVTLLTHRGKLSPEEHQAFNAMTIQSCSGDVLNFNVRHGQTIAKSNTCTCTQAIPHINQFWESQSNIPLWEMSRALIKYQKLSQTCQSAEEYREMDKNSSCESLVDHVVPQQDCNLIKNNEHAPVQCCDYDKEIENTRIADVEENILSSQTLQSSYGFVVSTQSPELVLSPECTSEPFAWEDGPDRPTAITQVSGSSTLENSSKVSQCMHKGCGESTIGLCTDVTSNFPLQNALEEKKYSIGSSSPNCVQKDSKVRLDDQVDSHISPENAYNAHASITKIELIPGSNKKRKIEVMDGMYEEHVVPGDETMHMQQLTQEISLYATNFNIQRSSTGTTTEYSCDNQKPSFKWGPVYESYLNDPGPELDKAKTSVREILPNVIPISNCTRPRRIGLSKKHSVKHLHKK